MESSWDMRFLCCETAYPRTAGPSTWSQGIKKMFEPVDLDFVDRLQVLTKLAGGEAVAGEPDDVVFGEVDQETAGVFAIGHARVGQDLQRMEFVLGRHRRATVSEGWSAG